jgi:hypothetical protein
MSTHFHSFTAEAMQAFRQSLTAESQRRTQSLGEASRQTSGMLAGFRKNHTDAESQRRQQAASLASSRRRFMNELRSRVNALKERFERRRQERVEDRQELNRELRAASNSFRNGAGRPARSF